MSIESLVQIGATALTALITEVVKKKGTQVIDRLDVNLTSNEKRQYKDATRNYVHKYIERHGIIKILNMRDPIYLESIYTKVRSLEENRTEVELSVRSLEERYAKNNERTFEDRNRAKIDAIDIANQKKFLMILGGPGAGKSVFLKKIGLESFQSNDSGDYKHNLIPVFIELKQFGFSKSEPLEDLVVDELETCGFPNAREFTSLLLQEGKFLILLDGLDEISQKYKNRGIRKIRDFVDKYSKNRFIISCRLADDDVMAFNRFSNVEIAPFEDEQVKTFIDNWFQEKSEWGKRCWEVLNDGYHKATKELVNTPLLLTLICILFKNSGNLPINRSTLYERVLRVMLEEWDAQRQVPRESPYKGLDTKVKEILLQEIAYNTFLKDEKYIRKHIIARNIEESLVGYLSENIKINGGEILDAIEIQHGVLVERQLGIYSFSHLTLQEYLTAQKIFSDSSLSIDDLIGNHIFESRWREVFLLLSGLLRSSDSMLTKLSKVAVHGIEEYPNIIRIFEWANEITDVSHSEVEPAARRSVAIYLARSLSRAFAITGNKIVDDLPYTQADATQKERLRHKARQSINRYAVAVAEALEFDVQKLITLANAFASSMEFYDALNKAVELVEELERLDFSRDINYPGLLSDLSRLRAEALPRTAPSRERQIFQNEIKNIFLSSFRIDERFLRFSLQELEAMSSYFYSVLLVIDCKNHALKVTHNRWLEIKSRLVKV